MIRDEPAVASPPEALRTQVGCSLLRRERYEVLETRAEVVGISIVSISAEGRNLPCDVRRIGILGAATASERLEPSILDAHAFERARKFVLVELRPSLRGRIRSHIGEREDFMLREQREELLDRMRRVPEG